MLLYIIYIIYSHSGTHTHTHIHIYTHIYIHILITTEGFTFFANATGPVGM
jgi:hypothetical protein